MKLFPFRRWFLASPRVPLRFMLSVPFVLQTVGTVAFICYFCYRSSQATVEELSYKLIEQVGDRIDQGLGTHLNALEQINQLNAAAIQEGTLDTADFNLLEQRFIRQLRILPAASGLSIVTEQKAFLSVGTPYPNELAIRRLDDSTSRRLNQYSTDPVGRQRQLESSRPGFDPQQVPPDNPWYQMVKRTKQSHWRLVVSLKKGQDHPILMVANYQPLYDRANQFQGVIGSAFYLTHLGELLQQLEIGETGQAFIVDQTGALIATSTGEVPFRSDIGSGNAQLLDPDQQRLSAVDSGNQVTRDSARFLMEQLGRFNRIDRTDAQAFSAMLNRQRYFLQVRPLQMRSQLDWMLVTAVPASDFTETLQQSLQTALLFSAVTLLLSVGLSAVLSRSLTTPITRLSQAAKQVAQGNFDDTIASDRPDELGDLSRSFDYMVSQLKNAFAGLRVLNQALIENEDKTKQILETLPLGVAMHRPDGSLAYLNAAGRQLLELWDDFPEATVETMSQTYALYRSGTEQLYPIDELPAVRALRGEQVIVDDILLRRPHRVIPLEIHSTPLFDSTGKVIASVNAFQDITDRKAASQVLTEYNQLLAAQVAERTEALAESEERFRRAFDDAGIGMAIVSLTGRFLRVNQALCQMLGYTDRELLSHEFHEITHPDEVAESEQVIRRLAGSESFTLEKRYLHKRGHVVWVLLSVSLLRDSQQQSLYYISQIQDISDRKQVEAALRQSEARNRAVLAAIPDLMIIVSGDGIYLDLIRRNKDIDLIAVDTNPIGKQISELLPPEIAERELRMIQAAIATQTIQTCEQAVWLRGRQQYEEIRVVPYGDNAALLMIRDITNRRRAEDALRASEERLREIAQTLSQLFFVRSAVSGQFLYVSPAYEQMWGRSCASLYQDPDSWLDAIHPDDLPSIEETLERQFQGKPVQREYRIIQPNGNIRWLYTEISLIQDQDGKPLRFVGLAEDITDRKRAEEALRQSEAQYRAMVEDQTELVCRFLPDGTLTFVNNTYCRYFNQRAEDLIGQAFMPLIPEEDRPIAQANFASLSIENPFVSCEHRVILPNGEVRWQQWTDRAIFDEQGQLREYHAVGRDITDLKRIDAEMRLAKEAAETANRAKSVFLANMSHELRTPLNAILGFTQLIARDRNLTPLQQEQLTIINRNGEYLLQLINDVLSISKIEAGRITLEEHSFDLYALLDTLEGLFRLRADAKGLHFECSRSIEVPQFVHTDERKLRQILTNLLDNAIKFTHHGSVTLRLRALDPAGNSHVSLAQTHKNQLSLISDGQPHPTATVQVLYFEVADTGVGIAANELPTIFDAFVQSESGRESLHGTGLGLAISRRFVQLLGGDITATSQLGQGTTFRFSISVRSAEVTSVRASHASRRVIGLVQDQPTYRVLVADDADAHRQLLVQWLSTVGFEVRPASNGQAAIEQWREFAPHLIWMDMRMPVMDGFEAVRLIRMQELSARTAAAIDRNPEQPIPGSEAPDLARSRPTTIIAITAAVFEEEQQDILTVGCDDIVVKPCSESVIFEKIAHHLGVTYLYEEPVDAGCEDNGADTPGADRAAPLLAAIQSMPSEWRLRVNYAARRANEPEIFQLLEDIPPAQIELKTAIVNLMQQFQLDQLIQWTQLPGGAADSPETDRDDNSDPNSPPLFDHDDS